MKKIIIIIGLIILLITILWLSAVNIAAFVGNRQNSKVATYQVTSPQITYIGDSLTNGFYSSGGLKEGNFGYRTIVDTSLNATSNNFAVGGYTSSDVLKQLNEDVSIDSVNQQILTFQSASESDYPLGDMTTISQSIEDSDYVIATIGANDVLQTLLIFNDDGTFSVNFDNIIANLKTIRARKYEIYNKIYEINPDVEIIDVGIYFAYPHISDLFTRMLYPVLVFTESYLFIEDDTINTHKVTIRDNMQADIKNLVDNPNDIHPSQAGYEVIANQILKEIGSLK